MFPMPRTGPAIAAAAMILGACSSGSSARDVSDDGTDACAPSGCIGTCLDLSAREVATMVNGCVVVRCCVSPDAGDGGELADGGSE